MTGVVANTRYGQMVVPPHDQYIGRALLEQGSYCHDELAVWLQYVPVGGVVIDAGANVGAHTMGFAQRVGPEGRVYAFEPQKALYDMLVASLAMNGITNVTARCVACGPAFGAADIAILDYEKPNNFGGLRLGAYSQAQRLKYAAVGVIPLDSLDLPRVDLVKIDVEGMELDVLLGAEQTIARCVPTIVVEMNGTESAAWLADRGYTLYHQATPLGDLWPQVGSFNYIAVPEDKPAPVSLYVEPLRLEVATS